jgi:hypothetical protein
MILIGMRFIRPSNDIFTDQSHFTLHGEQYVKKKKKNSIIAKSTEEPTT